MPDARTRGHPDSTRTPGGFWRGMRAGSHFDPRSSTHSERLLRRWADRPSPTEGPVGRQTATQAEASDEEKPPVAGAEITE